jgi:hypothetical protein
MSKLGPHAHLASAMIDFYVKGVEGKLPNAK